MFKLTPFDEQVLTLFGMTFSKWRIDVLRRRLASPQLQIVFGPSLYGLGMQARMAGTHTNMDLDNAKASPPPRKLSLRGQILLRREYRRVVGEAIEIPVEKSPADAVIKDLSAYGMKLFDSKSVMKEVLAQRSGAILTSAAPSVPSSYSRDALNAQIQRRWDEEMKQAMLNVNPLAQQKPFS